LEDIHGTHKSTVNELKEQLDKAEEGKEQAEQQHASLLKKVQDVHGQHKSELEELQEQVDRAEEGRDQAEQQHASLLERVKNIQLSLRDRMKGTAVSTHQI
jgi:chromosome segregation ATPase